VNKKVLPKSHDTIFCTGCNARFLHIPVAGVCPRCGVTVDATDNPALQETLLLRDAAEHLKGDEQDFSTDDKEFDQLIGGQLHVYRCESLLGRGGMGRVYLAQHTDLERKCALKILSPRVSHRHVDYTARFVNEGKAAAALIHPNIIITHAIGESQGYHFLEMEFIAGRSLQQLIDREGPLAPVRATALTARIADGISAAHQAGVIHRDLKPDNVLMTHRGVPKIADFGLAKRVISEGTGSKSEKLAGTPNFMAPELFQKKPASPVSDVYALGVCYYLLLTGHFPFTGGSLSELKQAAINNPLPNVRQMCPNVTLEMAECLSLLLAKAPENRPRDGIEAAQLLHAVSGQIRDVESLLTEAFQLSEGISWIRAGRKYRLILSLPDGRKQVLFVEPSDHKASERLLLIYSVCCPAKPEFYEDALKLNAEISHGGLSIREIDGEKHFVMVDTYPRSTVDPEEIRRSVLEVAYRADDVEKLLTGLDRN
jgi:serine/threonine protein kinase